MVADGNTLILLTLASVALLLGLILVDKMHAFLALLVSSMALGLAAGMEPSAVIGSIKSGLGGAMGSIAIILAVGAMIGRFLEHSGGGRVLADWLLEKFGRSRAPWAVLTGAFLIGLPIFFDVAFIILAPVLWSLARESKRSILFFGLPCAAALTVTHALVAPHPAPAAAAAAMGADLGLSIVYGIVLSIPMALVGGMVYGGWIAKRIFVPVPEIAEQLAAGEDAGKAELPPPTVSLVLFVLLMPIGLIFAATISEMLELPGRAPLLFLGDPATALILALFLAMLFLGARRGIGREQITKMAGGALGPIAGLLLITGAGGSFKQVINDCGVGPYAAGMLGDLGISPLLVGYLIAALLRVAQGSATVSIITAAGIMAPIAANLEGYSPEMMVLAIACGGTALSHVNDSGFWIVNQYLGMTVSQTLKSWSVMKMILSLVGIALVLAAQALFF